ncbi:MAG: nucleotidyltransferase substrate binding protein [Prevotella sp.]
MSNSDDIRWIQRLDNYERAVKRLDNAVALLSEQRNYGDDVDDLLKEGLIQRYEYTQELAWKLMKDYEEFQGYTDIQGSRDAIRRALAMGVITDRTWMDTIASRNITSHCYDEAEFNAIYGQITMIYAPLFREFCEVMKRKKDDWLYYCHTK